MGDLINRQAAIEAPDDRISYAIICDKFPIPQTRYTTYDLAVKWAKLDQPNHRPFYIVKCTEHFEICNRQAAIDAAIEATDDWSGKIKYDRSGWNKAIKDLPPAQLGTMAVRGYPIDADYLMKKVAEEYGERARDALYRIIRYMPPAQPEQRWIPCSGTIDIPDHEVLCCDRYGSELIGWLSYVDDQWLCESDGEMMYDPVAWREKPEPYREEGDRW